MSMAYTWQIEQMGSVSQHPLRPGGFSARSSCTGTTCKHRQMRSWPKSNIKQTGFSLLVCVWENIHIIMNKTKNTKNLLKGTGKSLLVCKSKTFRCRRMIYLNSVQSTANHSLQYKHVECSRAEIPLGWLLFGHFSFIVIHLFPDDTTPLLMSPWQPINLYWVAECTLCWTGELTSSQKDYPESRDVVTS